ncbi:hypothetical protein L596_021565 [Steinernema carpocapsae]|uniref:Uncharacterized protein n=1 Tax=Steinernema carpocapsae TaxID=34508 RepID=A0A4U5MJ65_STECR|nr:hypothetical protein L596_021565 [Steinernema carpocapsae]
MFVFPMRVDIWNNANLKIILFLMAWMRSLGKFFPETQIFGVLSRSFSLKKGNHGDDSTIRIKQNAKRAIQQN